MPKIAILVSAYRRPEYTRKCMESLLKAQLYTDVTFYCVDDGSRDNTREIFDECDLPSKTVISHRENKGLRNIIMDFFKWVQPKDFDFIGKIDNDCTVPKHWLKDIMYVLENSDVDILSPNVNPSQAAFRIGNEPEEGQLYRPSEYVGGLWFMKKSLIDDIDFESHDLLGITGAFSLLDQIIIEKEPKIGWLTNVTFEDIGHWSGKHPEHIKTGEHAMYYNEIGRKVSW